MSGIQVAFEVYIDSRGNSFQRGRSPIQCSPVGDRFSNCSVITNYDSFEAPLLPQYMGQGEGVRCGRHPVDGIKGTHNRPGAGFNCSVEGREIPLTQTAVG